MLEVINRIQDIYPVTEELEKIYAKQTYLSFYSPTYVIKCFELFLLPNKTNRLYFVLIKKENLITGYLPLYIDENNIIRFIFDKHTDYCGCVGGKTDHHMVKELCKIIENDKTIKGLEFENLLPCDPLLNYSRHNLGIGTVIYSYNNHSFLKALPDEGLLKHLKSLEKGKLKRIVKKNEAFSFETFDNKQDFPMQKIKALRHRMIESKRRESGFLDDNYIDFIKSLYEAGELEIFAKLDNDHLISASFVLINNNGSRIVWIDLYDDVPFINLSAYIEYIQHLDKNNIAFLSLGRGSYDYKSKNFFPQIENLYNVRYHKSKFRFLFTNFHAIKQFVKRLIRKAS